MCSSEPGSSVWLAGRTAFGLAMVGFGLVGLSQVDFLTSLQPVPEWVPGYRALAALNGLVLAGAGLAIIVSRAERVAPVTVAILFSSCIVLLHVPSAFWQPELLRSPWWIRTFESVALVAGAMTLAGGAGPVRHGWIGNSRIAFGLSMPVFGVLHLIYAESTASLVPPWYAWPLFWAYFTGIAQIVGGLAIAMDVWSGPAAILAGTMYGVWTLTLHLPRVLCRSVGDCPSFDLSAGVQPVAAEVTSLFVALGMAGAAWLVAGSVGPTERGVPRDTATEAVASTPSR